MGTHPIFESDFDCLTECRSKYKLLREKKSKSILKCRTKSRELRSESKKRRVFHPRSSDLFSPGSNFQTIKRSPSTKSWPVPFFTWYLPFVVGSSVLIIQR